MQREPGYYFVQKGWLKSIAEWNGSIWQGINVATTKDDSYFDYISPTPSRPKRYRRWRKY